jgi:hypothetical protein
MKKYLSSNGYQGDVLPEVEREIRQQTDNGARYESRCSVVCLSVYFFILFNSSSNTNINTNTKIL